MSPHDKLARVRLQIHQTPPRLRTPEAERVAPAGVTSPFVKNQDPLGIRKMVERFNEKRRGESR